MDIFLKTAFGGLGLALFGMFVYLDTEIDEVRYIVMDLPEMAVAVSSWRIPSMIAIFLGYFIFLIALWLSGKNR